MLATMFVFMPSFKESPNWSGEVKKEMALMVLPPSRKFIERCSLALPKRFIFSGKMSLKINSGFSLPIPKGAKLRISETELS